MNMPVVIGRCAYIGVNMAVIYGDCRCSVYAESVGVAVGKCRYCSYIVNVSRSIGLWGRYSVVKVSVVVIYGGGAFKSMGMDT
jgi:hypothetical protein